MPVRFTWNNADQIGEFSRDALGQIDLDDGLDTAVEIALFTDRRTRDGESSRSGHPGGWWGATFPLVEGFEEGSGLWLAEGGPLGPDDANAVRLWAADALAHMVDIGLASSVTTSTEILDAVAGILALKVVIVRPTGLRWQRTWQLKAGEVT